MRIWPLYFLLVIIGLWLIPFVLKTIGFQYTMPYAVGQIWWMYFLFLPFLVNILFGNSLLEPLWSIGVEECFYLIWAPLMKFFKTYMLPLFGLIIVMKITLMMFFMNIIIQPGSTLDIIRQIIDTMKIEAMAIGGIGAYYVFCTSKPFDDWKIFAPIIQFLVFILLIWRLVFYIEAVHSNSLFGDISAMIFNTPVFSNVLLYILFLWLILFISLYPKQWIKLDKRWLNALGDVSYGIYMYQMLIIFGAILFFKGYLQQLSPFIATVVFYLIISIGTIGISFISKKLFENQFLKWKNFKLK